MGLKIGLKVLIVLLRALKLKIENMYFFFLNKNIKTTEVRVVYAKANSFNFI